VPLLFKIESANNSFCCTKCLRIRALLVVMFRSASTVWEEGGGTTELYMQQFTPSASVRQTHQSQQTRYRNYGNSNYRLAAAPQCKQHQHQQQQRAYYVNTASLRSRDSKSLIAAVSSKSSATGCTVRLDKPHSQRTNDV